MDRFIDVTVRGKNERERMVSLVFKVRLQFGTFLKFALKFLESFLWVIKHSDKEKTPFFQKEGEE